MHNPFFTLGIITISLKFIVHPALAGKWMCWSTRTAPGPLIYRECYNIITQQIPATDGFKDDTPLVFSRDRGLHPDLKLPYTWQQHPEGECIVGMDIASTMGGSDKTTLDDIMTAAFVVAVECVIKPPHLGGIMFEVGWGKKLNVVLISEKEHSGLALTGANRTVQTGDTA